MGLLASIFYPIFSFINAYKWYFIIAILIYLVLTIVFRHARSIITVIFGVMILFFVLTHLGGIYNGINGLMTDVGQNSEVAANEYVDHVSENIIPDDSLTPAEKVEKALGYGITGKEDVSSETLPTSEEKGLSGTLDYVANSGKDESKEQGAFARLVAKIRDGAVGLFNEVKSMFGVPEAEKVENGSVESQTGTAEVHFIDVGQADCTLITDGDGAMLIDCGNYADIATVEQYLSGLGIERLDYFVLTHPHEDHIGCAAQIMRDYDVEKIIMPDVASDATCYTKAVQEIQSKSITVDKPIPGKVYDFGEGSFTVYGPITEDDDELNNDSVVLKYSYGDISFLLTGDAEAAEEAEIVEAGYNLSATVYKVGHHGSSSSSSSALLNAVRPQYAVISVGTEETGNEYGHPTKSTLLNITQYTSEIYRTDQNGTVVFTTDGKHMQVDCEKEAAA